MNSKEEKVRAAIADQAAEWLVANDDGLDAQQSAALAAWLTTSPLHVEEFLRASVIARDLREARTAPEYSLETVLAHARADEDTHVSSFWPRVTSGATGGFSRRWVAAAVTLTAVAVLSVSLFSRWNDRPVGPTPVAAIPTLHFETRHGEQLSRRLADNSMLHLNTDSAITIRFSKTERLVLLTSGQAEFEVAHDPARAFRVLSGSAEVIAVGTQFDVRLKDDSTVVTVVEGRVAVGLSPTLQKGGAAPDNASRYVQVAADQQIRVTEATWPAAPIAVDAQHATGWLRREVVFDHEPLERVVAEFNRYAPTPIEISTPALRKLEISGSFATDDTDAFVAFLRSLKGLRVEVTPTRIQLSQQSASP
jgi:transmembrane sensor